MRARDRIVVGLSLGAAVVGGLIGCAGPAAAPAPSRPAAAAPARVVQSYRHSQLLGFERPTDPLFVQAQGISQTTSDRAHTGQQSLHVLGGQSIDIKLSSLMSGRPFPGDWTLLGAHLQANRPTQVDVSLLINGDAVLRSRQMVSADQWTEAMLDLAPLAERVSISPGDAMLLRFDLPEPVDLWIDDVLLVDNTETFVAVEDGWQIRKKGHVYVVEQPQRFRIELKADPAQRDPWALIEANPLRAIFQQQSSGRRWVIYSDGRRYENGVFKPTWSTEFNDDFAAQHRAPAQVSVPEEHGRLERRTAGDANNDGYNEQFGSYQLSAAGGRMDITLSPRTELLVMPVLEIAGLPPGKLVVTVEGELVSSVHRAEDGTVLVVLPHKMGRPATVNVRVQ